jgi:adenylyl- and sulfurtransferase ThiI
MAQSGEEIDTPIIPHRNIQREINNVCTDIQTRLAAKIQMEAHASNTSKERASIGISAGERPQKRAIFCCYGADFVPKTAAT